MTDGGIIWCRVGCSDSSKPATPVWTFTPKPPSPDIAINFTHPPAVDPVSGVVSLGTNFICFMVWGLGDRQDVGCSCTYKPMYPLGVSLYVCLYV